MDRIAVLLFTTLQAWQGQPSTQATATGTLCPGWKNVKCKNIPMQTDQKLMYPSDSYWEWCWQKRQSKSCFLQLSALLALLYQKTWRKNQFASPFSRIQRSVWNCFLPSLITSSVSEISCNRGKRKAALEHGWHTEEITENILRDVQVYGYIPANVFTLFTSSTLFSLSYFNILADAFISQGRLLLYLCINT